MNQGEDRIDQEKAGPDHLEFRYESDASASFLVVTGIGKAAEYQCGMLGRNAVNGLITPERLVKDGLTCFYYNITSRVPLSVYIKRKKLSRPQFLKFVLDISSAIHDSYGYLLNASNFVLSQDYIYICPDTLEPCLVYVPAEGGTEDCDAFKSFVSELLLQHIHVEGFDSENIVQRILSAVKSEAFNLKYFVRLISELLYGGKRGDPAATSAPHEDDGGYAAFLAGGEAAPACESMAARGGERVTAPAAERTAARGGEKAAASDGPKNRLFMVFALSLQFIMALLIYLCRGLIDRAGSNHTANYAAVLLIVLAIDALVLKKLLASGMIKPRPGLQAAELGHTIPDAPRPRIKSAERPEPDVLKRAIRAEAPKTEAAGSEVKKLELPGTEAPKMEVAVREAPKAGVLRTSNKTELLGWHTKGVRVLKSTGKRAEDRDIVLDRDDFIIGRLEGHVDHVINNNAVGKLHAELISRGGTSYVRDLNSMNGTFINDNRIDSNKDYELKPNDRLRLANSEYIFMAEY